MLNRRLQRLVQVYTCQNATLLEISCTGSLLCKTYGMVGFRKTVQQCRIIIKITAVIVTKLIYLVHILC